MKTWMTVPGAEAPLIAVFRGEFTAETAGKKLIRFSADERCQLYLDGKLVSNGPERGITTRWYCRETEIEFSAGRHFLCARVIAMDKELTARGQLSIRHGFWIEGIDARWTCQKEDVDFEKSFPDFGSYAKVKVGSRRNHEILEGKGGTWLDVEYFEDDRQLFSPDVPEMMMKPCTPTEIRPGVFEFDEYIIAYANYHFSGKGNVKISWAEAPYYSPEVPYHTLKGEKRDRKGTYFFTQPDEFEVDGEFTWPLFYFRAGRYVIVEADPGVKVDIEYFRTGYPLPEYKTDNPLLHVAFNTLRNCCFETFMDCPFYEQMSYIGDGRIDALCTYMLGNDHSLARKAIRCFAASQQPDGSILSVYPCIVNQGINSFMLIWLLMLNDYYKLHGRDEVVEEVLPAAEKLLGYLDNQTHGDFLQPHDNWNFIDWCEGWDFGAPIGDGPNSVLNLFYVLALRAHSDTTGDSSLRKKADDLLDKIRERFYNPKTGLFYDFVGNPFYSEHAQTLALLLEVPESPVLIENLKKLPRIAPGTLPDAFSSSKNVEIKVTVSEDNIELIPCSIYFSFYYLEMCRKYDLKELHDERLKKYFALLENNLTTLPEEFGNPRSDCHAWSSHIMLADAYINKAE